MWRNTEQIIAFKPDAVVSDPMKMGDPGLFTQFSKELAANGIGHVVLTSVGEQRTQVNGDEKTTWCTFYTNLSAS
ncbi:MAG: hypothetical protein ACKVJU_12175 [Verrucomicrobiales bacterium]